MVRGEGTIVRKKEREKYEATGDQGRNGKSADVHVSTSGGRDKGKMEIKADCVLQEVNSRRARENPFFLPGPLCMWVRIQERRRSCKVLIHAYRVRRAYHIGFSRLE